MPAYNFKAQFADKVKTLTKRQTIRPKRKRPTKPGDTLYLYTGMRTRQCRKLLETKCKSVEPVDIYLEGDVWVNGQKLLPNELIAFVQADGFDNIADFLLFFDEVYGLPLIQEVELLTW